MNIAGQQAPCAIGRLQPDRDLDAVGAIEAAVFSSPWTKDMLLAVLEPERGGHAYVARSEQAVRAYCIGQLVVDELHIHTVAVAPAWLASCSRRSCARRGRWGSRQPPSRCGARIAPPDSSTRVPDSRPAAYDRATMRTRGRTRSFTGVTSPTIRWSRPACRLVRGGERLEPSSDRMVRFSGSDQKEVDYSGRDASGGTMVKLFRMGSSVLHE